jgi:serine/threonine-protein kinase
MDLPARIGRYDVEHARSTGNLLRVIVGRDSVLGRRVALTIVRDDLGLPSDVRSAIMDRVREQARSAAALMHPAITALFDVGEDAATGLFLVFEFVDGPTLRERLAHGAMTPLEVAGLARAFGAALTHAHASGFVYRDINPDNLLLAPSGPKLTGLGFATPSDLAIPVDSATPASLAYCAPEVLALRTFSPKADQFSFAATLYEALTGCRAFEGDDTLSVANAIARGKPPPVTRVASLRAFGALDTVFNRALAKRADSRFPSCEAFGRALANELERPVVVTVPLPPPSSRSSIVPRTTRRWQNAIALAAIAVIVTLVFVGRFAPTGVGDGVSLKVIADEFAGITTTTQRTAGASTIGRRLPKPASSTTPPLSVAGQSPYEAADARADGHVPSTSGFAVPRIDEEGASRPPSSSPAAPSVY